MRVVALAGGVGGAKLVDGLSKIFHSDDLSVIVNTGDDFFHLGLNISPDLDTVCYTLAGFSNIATGWGIRRDIFSALQEIRNLNGPDWFSLGNFDLGVHIFRTKSIRSGSVLSAITKGICEKLGINHEIIPMSDDIVPTIVDTKEKGSLSFQEYFVLYQYQPQVTGFTYLNHEIAHPVNKALEVLLKADLVVLCPSNPWLSLDPILSIPGYMDLIKTKKVIGVSPIINGRTVKGPAAKMFLDLGVQPTAAAVAYHYREILSGFMIHHSDESLRDEIHRWSIIPKVTNIMMQSDGDKKRLADEVLTFSTELM